MSWEPLRKIPKGKKSTDTKTLVREWFMSPKLTQFKCAAGRGS